MEQSKLSHPASVRNLPMNDSARKFVRSYLCSEVLRGRMLALVEKPKFLHISPIGAVPKDGSSWRIIHHLSWPRSGGSVNEFVKCPGVELAAWKNVLRKIVKLGKGALIGKVDAKSAFRQIPVCLEDRRFQGICFEKRFFVDLVLAMGCASSVYNWCKLADGLLCIWHYQSASLRSLCDGGGEAYIDDFIFTSSGLYPHTAMALLQSFEQLASQLGVELSQSKTVLPATRVKVLGIVIDTQSWTLSLDADKVNALLSDLQSLLSQCSWSLADISSCVGKLSWACKVVRPGRLFLWNMIQFLKSPATCTLHPEIRADMDWWTRLLPRINGTEPLSSPWESAEDLEIFVDASNRGYGGHYRNEYFNASWSVEQSRWHINSKELYAIYIGVRIWAKHFRNKRLKFRSDNTCSRDVWQKRYASAKEAALILREIYLEASSHAVEVIVEHLPGAMNTIADHFSRFQEKQAVELLELKRCNWGPPTRVILQL